MSCSTRFPRLASAAERGAIKTGIARARDEIRGASRQWGAIVNGWTYPKNNLGNFGDDYLYRALVALSGLAALEPAEATYLTCNTDQDHRGLDGKQQVPIAVSINGVVAGIARTKPSMLGTPSFKVITDPAYFADGINYENTAILIGAGRLGSALSQYPGLAEYGLRLVAIFDNDPAQAIATRRKFHDMASSEKALITGYHFPFPGVAHIEKTATGYREVPIQWDPLL